MFAGELLEVVPELEIARLGREGLAFPVGEGMGPGGGDAAAVAFRGLDDTSTQAEQLGADLGQRAADGRADLDLRLEELVGDPVAQVFPRIGEHARDPGTKLARLGVDDLVLFLDADGEFVGGDGHGGGLPEAAAGIPVG